MILRPMTDVEKRAAAESFVETWTGRGDEKQDAQNFWRMPNFRINNGQCGEHTYRDIIAAVNSAVVKRYSLQANGIERSLETLWSMVK